jgi:hypothetical protein
MDDKFLDSPTLIKTESANMRMNKKLIIASLILVLFLLSACKPLPSAVFRDESCLPPCWNQLMPGQTLFKDINEKIRLIQNIDSKSIKSISILQSNDGISFNFLPTMREYRQFCFGLKRMNFCYLMAWKIGVHQTDTYQYIIQKLKCPIL